MLEEPAARGTDIPAIARTEVAVVPGRLWRDADNPVLPSGPAYCDHA